VTYSFEVIGGNPGDIVPVLIATSLSSFGSDTTHGIGFAVIHVPTIKEVQVLKYLTLQTEFPQFVCTLRLCGTDSRKSRLPFIGVDLRKRRH